MAPFINLGDPIGVLLPVPSTVGSGALEILVPGEETLPSEDTLIVLLKFKPRLAPNDFRLLVTTDQQLKEWSHHPGMYY